MGVYTPWTVDMNTRTLDRFASESKYVTHMGEMNPHEDYTCTVHDRRALMSNVARLISLLPLYTYYT